MVKDASVMKLTMRRIAIERPYEALQSMDYHRTHFKGEIKSIKLS
jgi:hypothetical protein